MDTRVGNSGDDRNDKKEEASWRVSSPPQTADPHHEDLTVSNAFFYIKRLSCDT
jgi:hypothetical protein